MIFVVLLDLPFPHSSMAIKPSMKPQEPVDATQMQIKVSSPADSVSSKCSWVLPDSKPKMVEEPVLKVHNVDNQSSDVD